jgi:hypothetical protein
VRRKGPITVVRAAVVVRVLIAATGTGWCRTRRHRRSRDAYEERVSAQHQDTSGIVSSNSAIRELATSVAPATTTSCSGTAVQRASSAAEPSTYLATSRYTGGASAPPPTAGGEPVQPAADLVGEPSRVRPRGCPALPCAGAASSVSRWLDTDTYSPSAMDTAPATSPARPAADRSEPL